MSELPDDVTGCGVPVWGHMIESLRNQEYGMSTRVCHQLQNQMKQRHSLALEAYSTGRNAGFA